MSGLNPLYVGVDDLEGGGDLKYLLFILMIESIEGCLGKELFC